MASPRRIFASLKRRLFGKDPRPALNDLDRKLAKYLKHRRGFFIEVGANNGYAQSKTYYLEKRKRWRGILVEAIPELFRQCRAARPQSIVHNCALVGPDFPHSSIKMHYAHLMSIAEGAFDSEQRCSEHINAGVELQNLDATYTVEVPARTLESILDEIPQCPRIDFFSLDVEGLEFDVLRGLNLNKYRPHFLLVEARFFKEVDSLLTSHDYQLVEQLTGHDYLYAANTKECTD